MRNPPMVFTPSEVSVRFAVRVTNPKAIAVAPRADVTDGARMPGMFQQQIVSIQ